MGGFCSVDTPHRVRSSSASHQLGWKQCCRWTSFLHPGRWWVMGGDCDICWVILKFFNMLIVLVVLICSFWLFPLTLFLRPYCSFCLSVRLSVCLYVSAALSVFLSFCICHSFSFNFSFNPSYFLSLSTFLTFAPLLNDPCDLSLLTSFSSP